MLPVALAAARAGAQVLRSHGLPAPGADSQRKGAGDYVTATDLASEIAILEVLAALAPSIPVLAEEAGGTISDLMWAVDPLDGTTNFIRGFPAVAVSVGLLQRGTPMVGVVIAPFLDQEFTAARGLGATLNGRSLPRLGAVEPAHAVITTGLPFRTKARLPEYMPVLKAAVDEFEDVRRVGAAALDLAWTAAGTFDGYFELILGTWDMAAGACLVMEAGGVVTDWEGGGEWWRRGEIVAGRKATHARLLELIAGSGSRREPASSAEKRASEPARIEGV